MKRATHFLEVYKKSNGETITSCFPFKMSLTSYHLLGGKVNGWKTIAIFRIKYKKDENTFKRTESN